MIDALTHRLVRSITHLMGVTGVVFLLISRIRANSYDSIVAALVCAFVGGLLFAVINKIAPGGLGGGDVRLVPFLVGTWVFSDITRQFGRFLLRASVPVWSG